MFAEPDGGFSTADYFDLGADLTAFIFQVCDHLQQC